MLSGEKTLQEKSILRLVLDGQMMPEKEILVGWEREEFFQEGQTTKKARDPGRAGYRPGLCSDLSVRSL